MSELPLGNVLSIKEMDLCATTKHKGVSVLVCWRLPEPREPRSGLDYSIITCLSRKTQSTASHRAEPYDIPLRKIIAGSPPHASASQEIWKH